MSCGQPLQAERWWEESLQTIHMSEEQRKAFLEAIKADSGLQEKLKAAADADAVVAIAKAAGFVISVDDLKNAQLETSEGDLESMSGSTGPTPTVIATCGGFIFNYCTA